MLQEILTVGFFTAFLSAAVRLAMPLMYGGLGEMIAERAGILNIGMEGVMLSGAFFSFAGAWYFHSIPVGLLCGMLGGMAVSLLHGLLTIRLAKDQRAELSAGGDPALPAHSRTVRHPRDRRGLL